MHVWSRVRAGVCRSVAADEGPCDRLRSAGARGRAGGQVAQVLGHRPRHRPERPQGASPALGLPARVPPSSSPRMPLRCKEAGRAAQPRNRALLPARACLSAAQQLLSASARLGGLGQSAHKQGSRLRLHACRPPVHDSTMRAASRAPARRGAPGALPAARARRRRARAGGAAAARSADTWHDRSASPYPFPTAVQVATLPRGPLAGP